MSVLQPAADMCVAVRVQVAKDQQAKLQELFDLRDSRIAQGAPPDKV